MSSGGGEFHGRALATIRSGEDEAALADFAEALRRDPSATAVRLDCARHLTCLFRFAAAREHLEAACRSMPGEPAVARAAGEIAMMGRAPALALGFLRRFPNHAASRFDSAVILERFGELEAASEALAAAEKSGGPTVDGRLLAARLASRNRDAGQALDILSALEKNATPKPWTLARIYYARGHAFDSLGQFDAAFAAWSAAKDFLRPLAGDLLAEARQQLAGEEARAEALTPEVLSRWRCDLPSSDEPRPVFLTGYPRSGTTLVEHLLGRHAGLPSADENHAFRDLVWRHLPVLPAAPDPALLSRLLADYRRALGELSSAPEDSRRILDKNPQLLPVLPVLLRVMPEMPVIVVRRDPRDVILSCYGMPFGLNHHSVHFLTLADAADHHARVRRIASRLRDAMGKQMIVCRYETLVADPEPEIRRLAEWLGTGERRSLGEAESRVSYSPTYAEVAKPVSRAPVGRWRNYARQLEPVLASLEEFLGEDEEVG